MEAVTYCIVALALCLAMARPSIGAGFRLSPALAAFAGVLALMLVGVIQWVHLEHAAADLWRPFLTIASVMLLTGVAQHIGLIDTWTRLIEGRARSTEHLFRLVFGLGVLTSAALNNDAAILILTPLVVALVRRRYPSRPELVVPFAFAVFLSAGVAALPVSNPMNMVVADVSGIAFNSYVVHMLPVALVCWVLSYGILKWIFRADLCDETPPQPPPTPQPATAGQRAMLWLLAAVLLAYPILASLGGPVWIVAASGALAALLLLNQTAGAGGVRAVLQGVSWGTLGFLMAALTLSMGLREVGLVDRLADLYAGRGLAIVGVASTLGSAVLNNHPMAYLNMMALDRAGSSDVHVLAALVGGDLGPRLLPIGSLAGLLWLELLNRSQVQIGLRRFLVVGVLVTVPCLAAALLVLTLFL